MLKGRRIWPSFIPRSLRTTGPCHWILCSAKRLGQMKCNRIPGNKTFTHQTDWKWTNHRLAWVRKAKNQPNTELRALPLQSRRYQNLSSVTLKSQSDTEKNGENINDAQEMEITTEVPFDISGSTSTPCQTEFIDTTELPDTPEFSIQTKHTIEAKNINEEATTESSNLEVQKAAKMTQDKDVKNKEKIAVATVLREEDEDEGEEGAKAEKKKMSAVVQQKSDKEQKILQASSLAIPQKQQQHQQPNEEIPQIPENSMKNNEKKKKENLKEDKSVRKEQAVIEEEFFNATDALQEEKDVTIEEQRIGVESASEAAEASLEGNTKKVVKESEQEILHTTTTTEDSTEKQFNYAETKEKVEQNPQGAGRRAGMFQGWRYRLQTILRTLEKEARLKKRIQDERKDFEKQQQKSTSHKLLPTEASVVASSATSLRPPATTTRSQQEATDEVERGPAAIQIDSKQRQEQEPKDLSTTLTLPFTTQEVRGKIYCSALFVYFSETISSVEPSKEKYSGRNGFPRDPLDSPKEAKEPENWETLIICLGIASGLMAFLTVFSAFKYQILKSWPAEKKNNQVKAETQAAFYGVKFEALKQHDMTTDEPEDDKTTRLVCK